MKRYVFQLLYQLGISRLFAWSHRRDVMILCYHGVTGGDRPIDGDEFGLHVRKSRFVAQLDWLQQRYRVVSLTELLEALHERKALPDYAVVLTFDDGFRNFFTVALPILSERKLAASQFIVTDWVNARNGQPMPQHWTDADDAAFLSWAEIDAARSAGIAVGSHTCSHRMLASLSTADIARELRESLRAVESVAHPPIALAYPKGSYDERVVTEAPAAGYSCGLTTDGGLNSMKQDVFTLRRTLVGDLDDEAAFAARVSGLADMLSRMQTVIRRTRGRRAEAVQ